MAEPTSPVDHLDAIERELVRRGDKRLCERPPAVRRAWIRFTYLPGDPRWRIFPPGAAECAIFFDIGEGQLLTEESLARFSAHLEGRPLERQSRVGTGMRGRDRMLRPDGLLALHYHLLRRCVKRLSLLRDQELRAAGTVTACTHVARAWGLGLTRLGLERTAVVRRAQRIHREAALALIDRLMDDEARGLLVRVNAFGVAFAKANALR